MHRYVNEMFLQATPKGEKDFMLIDLPANAMIYLDKIAVLWKDKYPKLFKKYLNMCVHEKMVPGFYKYMEAEDGTKFLVVCSRWSDVGKYSEIESREKCLGNIVGALEDIQKDLGSELNIHSHIIGRRQGAWSKLSVASKTLFPNWFVYTKMK